MTFEVAACNRNWKKDTKKRHFKKIWKVKPYLFLFIDSYHMNYKEEKGY